MPDVEINEGISIGREIVYCRDPQVVKLGIKDRLISLVIEVSLAI